METIKTIFLRNSFVLNLEMNKQICICSYIEKETCLFLLSTIYIRQAEAFLFSNILAHIIWHSPQSSKDFFRKRENQNPSRLRASLFNFLAFSKSFNTLYAYLLKVAFFQNILWWSSDFPTLANILLYSRTI